MSKPRRNLETEPICIVDFDGYAEPGHFPTSFWADWNGEQVIFGGDWEGIPPWITSREPSEEEVFKYIKRRIEKL